MKTTSGIKVKIYVKSKNKKKKMFMQTSSSWRPENPLDIYMTSAFAGKDVFEHGF